MKVIHFSCVLLLLIGNSSILFSQSQSTSEDELALLREHYQNAENELRSKDLSSLSEEQKQERACLLDVLRNYRERGIFGQDFDVSGERRFAFVDAGGRRCAVAELLHFTGEDELIHYVASTQNEALIVELAQEQELLSWLKRSGLSFDEAARIQAPPHTPIVRRILPPPPPPGQYGGPADIAGSGGVGSTGSGRSASSTPKTAFPSPSRSSATTASNTGIVVETGAPESWLGWWNYNQTQYLKPNRLMSSGLTTGELGDDLSPEQLAQDERQKLVPALLAGVQNSDAVIRAACAISVGRLGGKEALGVLRQASTDSNLLVRRAALLGLGLSSAQEAVPLLLHQLKDTKALGDAERALIMTSLGAGRRSGMNERIDSVIASLYADLTDNEKKELSYPRLAYEWIGSTNPDHLLASEISRDEKESAIARARAVENLAGSTDPKLLSVLIHHLGSAKLDLRRSAALALGKFQSPMALAPMQTAFEMEKDILTKGFLAIAIGQQGGVQAKGFLLNVLKKENSNLRPWIVLSLGSMARRVQDPEIQKELAIAYREERNQENRGAVLLALGLSRSVEAFPLLKESLLESGSGNTRSLAGFGLSLLGDESSHELLRNAIPQEKCLPTRAVLAQALAFFGSPADFSLLAATVTEMNAPTAQADAAKALAFHGSVDSVQELTRIFRDEKQSAIMRAAAADALGLILSPFESYPLAKLYQQSNFTVFPLWLTELLQFSI